MNKPLSRETIEELKKEYPEGTRIICNHCADPCYPIPAGTTGTVFGVDDVGTIHVHWDNNRTLGLIPGEDSFSKITTEN